MNNDPSEKRLKNLKKNIRQDLDILKKYEYELPNGTVPRRLVKYRREIERLRKSLSRYHQEYEELQNQVAGELPAGMQDIADLLLWMDSKLDEIQNCLEVLIGQNNKNKSTSKQESQRVSLSLSDRATTVDLLGFKEFTEPIAKRISDLTDEDTPLSIGIFGEWGSGKTSFLKMIDKELSEKYKIYPIWFNAWKYDKEDNLWSALIQCIFDQTIVRGNWYRRAWIKLKIWKNSINLSSGSSEIIKKLTPVTIKILIFLSAVVIVFMWSPQEIETYLNQLNFLHDEVITFSGIQINIIKGLISIVAIFAARPDLFLKLFDTNLYIDFSKMSKKPTYREHIAFLDKFSEEFKQIVELVVDKKKPLVVIVDDLDRCLPDKALQVLESIKVFLDIERCVFLLAVDREIVEKVICIRYKDLLDITALGQNYSICSPMISQSSSVSSTTRT